VLPAEITPAIVVDRATEVDLPAVCALLAAQHLPLDGVAGHVGTMLVARHAGAIVGAAALETYRDGALLRSVVVDPAQQGSGLGSRLTVAALDLAAALGIRDVFLLTTTAEGYFPRFGFERIERAAVPASVQSSVEFTSACPSSAVVMRKRLEAGA
jgi:amino-acid N-acetyltransferase